MLEDNCEFFSQKPKSQEIFDLPSVEEYEEQPLQKESNSLETSRKLEYQKKRKRESEKERREEIKKRLDRLKEMLPFGDLRKASTTRILDCTIQYLETLKERLEFANIILARENFKVVKLNL